jgi:hypothetical protein
MKANNSGRQLFKDIFLPQMNADGRGRLEVNELSATHSTNLRLSASVGG